MIWTNFPLVAWFVISFWILAITAYILPQGRRIFILSGNLFTVIGILSLMIFILVLWINLERPPLRTLGETRLWYSFFLPLIGFITYLRWKYRWFLSYSLAMAILFLLINYYHPETYDKTLMPALQSPWFIPHVIVYIFSYALLAASSLVAIKGLYQVYSQKSGINTLFLADNLVYIGFAFLTLGLLFGALWAKAAWGHYWTWDPKETWAFLTWLGYLIYIHLRYFHPKRIKFQLWILALAFVILLICWFGINYLPSGQNSVHTYNSAVD
jgi:ABC-type transport system involved in cytochrome c biogenesis permease subunit